MNKIRVKVKLKLGPFVCIFYFGLITWCTLYCLPTFPPAAPKSGVVNDEVECVCIYHACVCTHVYNLYIQCMERHTFFSSAAKKTRVTVWQFKWCIDGYVKNGWGTHTHRHLAPPLRKQVCPVPTYQCMSLCLFVCCAIGKNKPSLSLKIPFPQILVFSQPPSHRQLWGGVEFVIFDNLTMWGMHLHIFLKILFQ